MLKNLSLLLENKIRKYMSNNCFTVEWYFQKKSFSSILSNSQAINNSVATLQKFETFLNLLVDNNDSLLKSERLMLKIVRLKFEIDACIKSLESFSNILLEIVDRSNIGYPSHYLFTRDFLTRLESFFLFYIERNFLLVTS